MRTKSLIGLLVVIVLKKGLDKDLIRSLSSSSDIILH
jgi:hypothetical protein